MWKDNILKLEKVSTASQGVHVMVKVHSPPSNWIFFAIYASNIYEDGVRLGDSLVDIAFIFKGSWLIGVTLMKY